MRQINDLLHSLFGQPKSSDNRPPKNLGADNRVDRAAKVTDMQANVSRIQQEILTLSNASGTQAVSNQDRAAEESMVELNRELETAQRELGKIQGRI